MRFVGADDPHGLAIRENPSSLLRAKGMRDCFGVTQTAFTPPTFDGGGLFVRNGSSMFIVYQSPLVDIRPFLNVETHRLLVPTFPLPQPGHDFLRSTGLVKYRLRGGVDPWPGEGIYCDVRRALRFELAPSEWPLINQLKEAGVNISSVFRRYLSDGEAIARIDLGFIFDVAWR